MSGYDTPHIPHILIGDIEEWPKIIRAYFEKSLSPTSARQGCVRKKHNLGKRTKNLISIELNQHSQILP